MFSTRAASAHAPTVAVTFPNTAGLMLNGVQTVRWTGSDTDGDPLTYTVLYSRDNAATWTGAAANVVGGSERAGDGCGSEDAKRAVFAAAGAVMESTWFCLSSSAHARRSVEDAAITMTSSTPTSIPAATGQIAAAPLSAAETVLADQPAALSPAFWRLVRTRRSIRRYLPQPVAEETVLAVLQAARWAPSAHNRQPWRFCVVTTPAAKQELSRRLSERWRQDLGADGAGADFIARRVAISHARLTTSPVLIVPSLTLEDMDVYSDAERNHAEYIMAVQSVALACQNLLLAAYDAGLAASWLCAPLFAPELVRDVLALPDHWQPQAILTLGYAAEQKEKERAPLAAQVIWR